MTNLYVDKTIAPIQINHWYKCVVEVDFTAMKVTWYLDGAQVRDMPLPAAHIFGIDKLLVIRGYGGADGPQPYYVDDLVVYTK